MSQQCHQFPKIAETSFAYFFNRDLCGIGSINQIVPEKQEKTPPSYPLLVYKSFFWYWYFCLVVRFPERFVHDLYNILMRLKAGYWGSQTRETLSIFILKFFPGMHCSCLPSPSL
jgi:hypothetical protein